MSDISTVKVKIQGMNFEDFLNKLTKNGISAKKIIRQQHNCLILRIETKNLKKLIAISKSACYNISVEAYYGIAKIIKTLTKNVGAIVGIIFVFLASILYSNIILKVEVNGTNRINSGEVVKFLKEINVSEFKPKSVITAKTIETQILQKFEDISLVSVCVVGSTLKINIKEKIYLETDRDNNSLDIVAPFDLQISNMIVSAGTAQVKVGDCVKKGEVIVAGFCLNENNEKKEIKAVAQINAKVYLTESVVVPPVKKIKVQTGNIVVSQILSFKNFKLNKEKLPDFKAFESSESETKLSILPFTVKKITYFELEEKDVSTNFEAEKDVLLKGLKYSAYNKLGAGDSILSEQSYQTKQGNNDVLVYSIVISKNI